MRTQLNSFRTTDMGASKTYILLMTMSLAYAVSAQEVVRRVPQGFLGMRGKKYYELGENDQLYKRKPQFFVGVKGKKDYELSDDINYKRAPMGFVGMRGKKDPVYPDFMVYPENFEYVPKRSGSLIGQIDYSTDDNIQEYPMLNEVLEEYLQKLRENINTDVSNDSSSDRSDIINNEVEKRANIHKFFGVRGKKSVQTKRPEMSFRGKFIGVRGKKDVKNSGAEEFLLDGPWPKRRMQSGFLGMRGKKWTDNDAALDSEPNSDILISN